MCNNNGFFGWFFSFFTVIILLGLILLLTVVGCESSMDNTPTKKVEAFFTQYRLYLAGEEASF